MATHNPRLGEDIYDRSLSSRLPLVSSILFRWQDGAVLRMQADVGPLGVLPLETIHAILVQLDLASLASLELVSKGMRRAVTSLPQLRAVAACAPDAMRAIWSARVGRGIVCRDIYEQLCRPTCAQCGFQPGHYLYLLACHRVCQPCLLGSPRYRPLRPREVAREFRMRYSQIRRLPKLRVPKYSPRARALRSGWLPRWARRRPRQRNTTGWVLIDREVALRASLRIQYDKGRIDQSTWASQTRERVAALRRKRPAAGAGGGGGGGVSPEYAYSAAVLFPWLDRDTQNVGAPALCRACRFGNVPASQWYYSETGLKDHIDCHGPIVDGAHVKPSA